MTGLATHQTDICTGLWDLSVCSGGVPASPQNINAPKKLSGLAQDRSCSGLTANPTRPDPRSESDRNLGSPLDPYTRGGGQAPRATKIAGHKSTVVEFSTNTGDPGTHENRGFGPETRPIAACGASARLDAF